MKKISISYTVSFIYSSCLVFNVLAKIIFIITSLPFSFHQYFQKKKYFWLNDYAREWTWFCLRLCYCLAYYKTKNMATSGGKRKREFQSSSAITGHRSNDSSSSNERKKRRVSDCVFPVTFKVYLLLIVIHLLFIVLSLKFDSNL